MLYPQQNDTRNTLDLSGFWDFKLDPEEVGEGEGWHNGLDAPRTIAVPASWNEQFQDTRDYMDMVWYVREFYVPQGWAGQRISLRVGSANYAAKVWINGEFAGEHYGGHLPFALEVTDQVVWGRPNTVAIQVENKLTPTRVPPGNMGKGGMFSMMGSHPDANFDFFPYGGLHRPVVLYAVPQAHVEDVTVVTEIEGANGIVKVHVVQAGGDLPGIVTLTGQGGVVQAGLTFSGGSAQAVLTVSDARLWCPEDPYLYKLEVALTLGTQVIDRYTLDVGIRTIAVQGNRVVLNGKPVFLTGFGKHEDFPVHGRGLNMPLIVKDNALLKWIGANSYRTSHYPYSEEAMRMADREGILIVDETPAVGLSFADGEENIQARLAQCKQQVRELVARDKNHPSVIMWSLANEPLLAPLGAATMGTGRAEPSPAAAPFFGELFDLVRGLDPTRLVTVEAPMARGYVDWLSKVDVMCVHRYTGWYRLGGQLERALEHLESDLDGVYEMYGKPIAITEFGADTIAGMHSDPAEMYSEEYQVEYLRGYLDLAARKEYIAGLHVWNFADFKTGQSLVRVGMLNRKGVFTRDRRPKMAAHLLRERWTK